MVHDELGLESGSLTESYERFEKILSYLSSHQFESYLPGVDDPILNSSKRYVVFTFDDGTKSQLYAAELLERYGYRGIFFIIPSRIIDPGSNYITPRELRELASHGHVIGVHGYEHRSMQEATEDETVNSLLTSKRILQLILGSEYKLNSFAFPYGHYTANVKDRMLSGYNYLYTVNPGYWDGISSIVPRMLITRQKDLEFFQNYISNIQQYEPNLHFMGEDGGTHRFISFLIQNDAKIDIESLRILAVSPDAEENLYSDYRVNPHPLTSDSVIIIDVREHVQRYYSPERQVLSFILSLISL